MSIEDPEVHLDDERVEIGADGEAADSALSASWMEELRRDRDKRVEVESLRLGMPTWGPADRPDLVVEYGVVDRPELEKFQRQARAKQKKGEAGASDADMAFIARATRAVYLRRPDTGKLVKLEKEGRPVRLDKRLGDMLGLDDEQNKNSQSLLLYLVKDNGVALGALAAKVAQWMTNTSADVEDEVLGE